MFWKHFTSIKCKEGFLSVNLFLFCTFPIWNPEVWMVSYRQHVVISEGITCFKLSSTRLWHNSGWYLTSLLRRFGSLFLNWLVDPVFNHTSQLSCRVEVWALGRLCQKHNVSLLKPIRNQWPLNFTFEVHFLCGQRHVSVQLGDMALGEGALFLVVPSQNKALMWMVTLLFQLFPVHGRDEHWWYLFVHLFSFLWEERINICQSKKYFQRNSFHADKEELTVAVNRDH